MNELFLFLTSALQITLLDIVLSGDNVGLIALAIRSLPKQQAKMASLIGVAGAMAFRILFASIFTTLITIQWLPIKLFGGLLLLKITWDLLKTAPAEHNHPQSVPTPPPIRADRSLNASQCVIRSVPEKKRSGSSVPNGVDAGVREDRGLWKAVFSIILADMSMSLDNVLAVGGAANGNVGLIAFGIALNLPLLFFGSQFVADLMNQHPVIIYFGAGVLMHTALSMILEEQLLIPYLPSWIGVVIPWVIAGCVLIYGYIVTHKKPQQEKKEKPKSAKQVHILHR